MEDDFGRVSTDTYQYDVGSEAGSNESIGFRLNKILKKNLIKIVTVEKNREVSTVLRKLIVFFLEEHVSRTIAINYTAKIPYGFASYSFRIKKDVRRRFYDRCKKMDISVSNTMRVLIGAYIIDANDPNSVFYNF